MGNSDPNILHKGMVPAQQALDLVLEGASSIGSETINLEDAAGRVLSDDLVSRRTQPPFSASAMDGYAVRAVDIITIPSTLNMIGESAAGRPFSGEIKKGECTRIFTGAPIPNGADTIIIQENVEADENNIKILQTAPEGKFVRPAGLDFKMGETLLRANTVLNAQNLSLAASMDYPELKVHKKPIVSILATGDELVMPGNDTKPGQIIASNMFGVSVICKEAGAKVLNLGIAKDTIEDLTNRVQSAIDAGADLIVTSGGASVGDHDLVKPVMEQLGFVFSFVKIAMRPGKPVIFGKAKIDGKTIRFLGLAGNPVSSLVSSYIFLKPLIGLLGGHPLNKLRPIKAKSGIDLPQNEERQDYMRATAKRNLDGDLIVTPFPKQDSSMLATLEKADCLVIRPPLAPKAKVGEVVEIISFRDV